MNERNITILLNDNCLSEWHIFLNDKINKYNQRNESEINLHISRTIVDRTIDRSRSNHRAVIEASHRDCPYGSPDAQTARHSFRSAYWNYKYYRANYLPSLSLTSDPNLNRAINKITMGDGSVKFVEQNLLNTDLTLNLSQNLSWTGGSFFLETSVSTAWICSANINTHGRLPP